MSQHYVQRGVGTKSATRGEKPSSLTFCVARYCTRADLASLFDRPVNL
jgi:hypothetical protein